MTDAQKLTDFQTKVLKSMPTEWTSVVGLTDIIYPRRFNSRAYGLHRSLVRDAITVLSRKGFVIGNGKGLFRAYDPDEYTAIGQEAQS